MNRSGDLIQFYLQPDVARSGVAETAIMLPQCLTTSARRDSLAIMHVSKFPATSVRSFDRQYLQFPTKIPKLRMMHEEAYGLSAAQTKS